LGATGGGMGSEDLHTDTHRETGWGASAPRSREGNAVLMALEWRQGGGDHLLAWGSLSR